MTHAFVEGVFLCVHTGKAPSDDEWGTFMRAALDVGGGQPARVGTLALTRGGGPTTTQRGLIKSHFQVGSPSVVMTNSSFARGIATAIGWFIGTMRAVSPEGLDDALDFMEVPQNRREAIRSKLIDMAHAMYGPSREIDSLSMYKKSA